MSPEPSTEILHPELSLSLSLSPARAPSLFSLSLSLSLSLLARRYLVTFLDVHCNRYAVEVDEGLDLT
jgi:hypothetical protein